MKSVFILLLFFMQLGYSQTSDKLKRVAIKLQIQAFHAEQRHQFDSAILFADSSIVLDSTRYEPFIVKAESQWFLKRFSDAAETYKKSMLVKKPDFLIGAYVLLGMLYDKAGMFVEAKEQYSLAITTWESGYQPPRFDKTEEMEYIFAFGLLGDIKKWKKNLAELSKKYPSTDYKQFANKSRQELLEHHFSPFGG